MAVVGRFGKIEHFRNIHRHEVETQDHILAVRVDESLYFANAAYLADEPTAALDSKRAGIVVGLLCKVAIEQDAAIIAVTHDEKIFDRFDRIFSLSDG